MLLVGSHTQAVDLLFGEVAPVTAADILLGESGKLYTVKFGDLVAQTLEDAAHDAVLARVNLDAYLFLIGIAGILDGIGLDVTILQRDAFSYLLHVVSRYSLIEMHMIDFLFQELRMRQLRCQVSVICQEQHTRSVTVQTAHRIDAFRTSPLDEVHHRFALLRIITGGDIILGFVEQYVDLLLQCYGLIMEANLIGTHHLGSQLVDNLAVHLDYASLYELVSLATAADTSISQELIQTDRFVGVEVLLLIFYTLLQRVFGMRIITRSMLTVAAALLLTIATTLLTIAAALLTITAALLTITAALLTVAAALLVATLLTIAATLLTIASLFAFRLLVVTGTVALLLTITATLLTIAATLLVATMLLTGTVAATLLTEFFSLIIITGTGTVATTLRCRIAHESCAKALRTEAAFLVVLITIVATLTIRACLLVNTRTG